MFILLLVERTHRGGDTDSEIIARLPQSPAHITVHNKADLAGEEAERREDQEGHHHLPIGKKWQRRRSLASGIASHCRLASC